jgi:hypothetical protein
MVRLAQVEAGETKVVSIASPFLRPKKATVPFCLQAIERQILSGGLESMEHAG